MRKNPSHPGRAIRLFLLFSQVAVGSCVSPPDSVEDDPAPAIDRVSRLVEELDLARDEAPSWVSIYDPEHAWNGYTLDFFERSVPILIDMNGEIVHSWPRARVRSRLRLLPNGNLLAIGLARQIVEYDWRGNEVWSYTVEGGYPHHDVIRLPSGNTMFIMARDGEPTDDLMEVDPAGQVTWLWRAEEALIEHLGEVAEQRDITHLNSLQVLPPNPWFDGGDDRFRPGNVLISARNLDAVYVIDRRGGEVVWKYDDRLDRQHEAFMIGPGFPGHGNILLFNNGLQEKFTYRQSAILEIDPTTKRVIWDYQDEGFFSPIVGVQQILPNGNVLIGSSLGPRNFEIDRQGQIVWQWTPPFKTKRPMRYAYDFTPRFGELGPRRHVPVTPPNDYRHLDRLVYRFAGERDRKKIELDGREQRVLRAKTACREILLPAEAQVQLAFGFDGAGLLEAGHSSFDVDFVASVLRIDNGQEVRSLAATLASGRKSWRSHRWDLSDLAFERVQICLQPPVVRIGNRQIPNQHAYWGNPRITGGTDRAMRRSTRDRVDDDLTPEELEVRREHLRTLGYID